jgi:hypothetical protein
MKPFADHTSQMLSNRFASDENVLVYRRGCVIQFLGERRLHAANSGGQVARKIADSSWLRLGATGYYGIICIFALYRFGTMLLGRDVTSNLTPLQLTIFAFLVFTSWCLLAVLSRRSDRIAALLYGVFYSGRIGIHFLHGRASAALQAFECAIIMTGLIVIIPGLFRALAGGRPQRQLQ